MLSFGIAKEILLKIQRGVLYKILIGLLSLMTRLAHSPVTNGVKTLNVYYKVSIWTCCIPRRNSSEFLFPSTPFSMFLFKVQETNEWWDIFKNRCTFPQNQCLIYNIYYWTLLKTNSVSNFYIRKISICLFWSIFQQKNRKLHAVQHQNTDHQGFGDWLKKQTYLSERWFWSIQI